MKKIKLVLNTEYDDAKTYRIIDAETNSIILEKLFLPNEEIIIETNGSFYIEDDGVNLDYDFVTSSVE